MKLFAIITGDIVDSTKLTLAERDAVLNKLQAIPQLLSAIDKGLKLEIFRGDSFQIGMCNVLRAMKEALIIRAYLRSGSSDQSDKLLDARLAIGIGSVDYGSNSLATSNGEAFQLSGRLLDSMDKSRLAVITPWKDVNEELDLSMAFTDNIVSSWTRKQSKIAMMSLLTNQTHYEIAEHLGISRQMVDKSLRASKEDLINAFIRRFETIVNNRISKESL